MPDSEFADKIAAAAKDAASSAAGAAEKKAKEAANAAAAKAGEAAHDASEAAKKAAVEKLGGEYKGDGNKKKEEKPKKKGFGKFVLLLIIILVVLFAGYNFVMPAINNSMITKDKVVTSSMLKKAVEIDSLSTAEFVYNGIAEKHKDNSDEVDYRISYDATVKAGVRMSDINISEPDDNTKTVTVKLPEIIITNVSVDMNTLSYMPNINSDDNSKLQDILTICEEDAKSEAASTGKFYTYAEDNLKTAVESLMKPLLDQGGYSIVWA